MNTAKRWPVSATPVAHARPDAAWAGAPAVLAERLSKTYDNGVRALSALSLCMGHGEFFGLLGPRGSGKTTLLRILATVLRADAGVSRVLGYDVDDDARQVRRRIGYMSQALALDPRMTGYENVRLAARLHGLSRDEADRRTAEVLTHLDLRAAAPCRAGAGDHGVRKRLALARAVVHRPRLLLLDDPTDGIAPHDQAVIWRYLRAINRDEDVTILLATDQLADAESVCRRVTIIDGGKMVATGTPTELKAQVITTTVTIRLAQGERVGAAAVLLERPAGVRAVWPRADRLELEVAGAGIVPILLRMLEEHEIAVRDLTISRPSLEEVFFRHTGRKIHDARTQPAAGAGVAGRG